VNNKNQMKTISTKTWTISCAAVCAAAFLNTSFAKPIKIEKFYHYPIPSGVRKILEQMPGVDVNNTHLGIVVQSLKTGRILYQRNANQLFAPASVLKLFTATAGLAYLKPNYRFSTQVYANGSMKQHTLHGDVTFKFNGDPTLKTKNVDQLIAQLKSRGVKRINGKVYIDNFAYNNIPAYPPGWIWDDLSYSYAAPLNAIIINENKFLLHFKPAPTLGKPPLLSTTLPPHVVSFRNRMQTTSRFYENCPVAIYSNDVNQYTVTGCLNKKWGEQRRSLAIRSMAPYARALIRQGLAESHIQYKGNIILHTLPPQSKLIASHLSPPLSVIMKKMLKDSDNLITNAIFKKMGETYYRSRGSWFNSIKAEEKILAKPTHINFQHNLINDGAGLSRYNLITPMQLDKVLQYAYRTQSIRTVMMKALPIAGKDGTLISRMLHLGRNQRIHAKTGSMTGVTSLAGFVNSKNNGPLSFVIMINGFVGKRTPYIQLEDNVCEYLVNAKAQRHHG